MEPVNDDGWAELQDDGSLKAGDEDSRHKSIETLRGYVRDAELFKYHVGAGLL